MRTRTVSMLGVAGLSLFLLAGCPSSESEPAQQNQGDSEPDPEPDPDPDSSNSAPTISGSPKSSVTVGESYLFTPTASDPDDDSLTFSIENKPDWADFASDSGELSGTTEADDAGTYGDISITVSDGDLSDTLGPFSIAIEQVSMGSATLSWTAPTQNSDGSPLDDLAGYAIYYGTSEGTYPNRIEVSNDSLTTYVVENLSPDTYYFVTTSINDEGVESGFSNVASKTVN